MKVSGVRFIDKNGKKESMEFYGSWYERLKLIAMMKITSELMKTIFRL